MAYTRRAVLATGVAIALAGCLGDDEDAEATVGVRTVGGTDVLVGPDDMTLYMFDLDEPGAEESACYDECAAAWPPLAEGNPTAGEGVAAALTTFERTDGEVQVAANGWPVYFFAEDENPGDAAGQGVNDVWWVLSPSGEPIHDDLGDDRPSGPY